MTINIRINIQKVLKVFDFWYVALCNLLDTY